MSTRSRFLFLLLLDATLFSLVNTSLNTACDDVLPSANKALIIGFRALTRLFFGTTYDIKSDSRRSRYSYDSCDPSRSTSSLFLSR